VADALPLGDVFHIVSLALFLSEYWMSVSKACITQCAYV
jgi:hypothetical protein